MSRRSEATRSSLANLLALGLVIVGGAHPARAARLLVVDFHANAVLQFDGTTGTPLGALVPSGSGGLTWPEGIALAPDGSVLVASSFDDRVLHYDGVTGSYLGAFVAAGSGGLRGPLGLAFGPDGNLYVASFFTNSILRYNGTTGAFIDTFVASGSGGLNGPAGLPVFGPDGRLYVISGFGNSVLRYDGTTGAFVDVFVPAESGGLSFSGDLAFGPDGNLYVTSGAQPEVTSGVQLASVLRYDGTTGVFIDSFVALGAGGYQGAEGLAFGPDGNVYVTSIESVLRFDGTTGAHQLHDALDQPLDLPAGDRIHRPRRAPQAGRDCYRPCQRVKNLGLLGQRHRCPRCNSTSYVGPMGQQAIAATAGAARESPWTQEAG